MADSPGHVTYDWSARALRRQRESLTAENERLRQRVQELTASENESARVLDAVTELHLAVAALMARTGEPA